MAIRAYHLDRGDAARDVCLIPSSAHGTNAASAVMAGLRVVVVASGEDGGVDLDDLRASAPSTPVAGGDHDHLPLDARVYEAGVVELCEIVHDHGGQVYVDGANLNALLGHAKPGEFGGDVSHLNLHKTFLHPPRRRRPGRRPGGRVARTSRRSCPPTPPTPTRTAAPGSARSAPRPTARRGSCRSPGPTCG